MEEAVLVRAMWLVTSWLEPEAILEDGAVYIVDGIVQDVGAYSALRLRYCNCDVVGDGTHLVIPGMVNAHSHGRGVTALRMGEPDDSLELRVFRSRLPGSPLMPRLPYWSVLFSCVRQLEAGITTTLHADSYFAGGREEHEAKLREIVRAYSNSGMRLSMSLGIGDRNTYAYIGDRELIAGLPPETREQVERWPRPELQFSDYLDMLERLSRDLPDVKFQLGPTNPVWCSDELLAALAGEAKARHLRVHTHLLETHYQKAYALQTYGQSEVRRLARLGILDANLSCAHSIWLTEDDISLLSDAGTLVVHNPSSNLRLRSGIAPTAYMATAGLQLAMGLDSMGINDDEDMLQEGRLAQLLSSPPGVDSRMTSADTVLQWITDGGRQVVGLDQVGQLKPGCAGDVLMARINWDTLRQEVRPQDVGAYVLQWVRRSAIEVVMVDGKILVDKGRYIHRDREEIEQKAIEEQYSAVTPNNTGQLEDHIRRVYCSLIPSGNPYVLHNSRW